VTELVQQERSEEEERGRNGQCDVLTVGEAGVLRREHRHRERPDDEREHDQPTPVDTDPDAGDPAQLEGRVHGEDSTPDARRPLLDPVTIIAE
jgi:hypothetical protein